MLDMEDSDNSIGIGESYWEEFEFNEDTSDLIDYLISKLLHLSDVNDERELETILKINDLKCIINQIVSIGNSLKEQNTHIIKYKESVRKLILNYNYLKSSYHMLKEENKLKDQKLIKLEEMCKLIEEENLTLKQSNPANTVERMDSQNKISYDNIIEHAHAQKLIRLEEEMKYLIDRDRHTNKKLEENCVILDNLRNAISKKEDKLKLITSNLKSVQEENRSNQQQMKKLKCDKSSLLLENERLKEECSHLQIRLNELNYQTINQTTPTKRGGPINLKRCLDEDFIFSCESKISFYDITTEGSKVKDYKNTDLREFKSQPLDCISPRNREENDYGFNSQLNQLTIDNISIASPNRMSMFQRVSLTSSLANIEEGLINAKSRLTNELLNELNSSADLSVDDCNKNDVLNVENTQNFFFQSQYSGHSFNNILNVFLNENDNQMLLKEENMNIMIKKVLSAGFEHIKGKSGIKSTRKRSRLLKDQRNNKKCSNHSKGKHSTSKQEITTELISVTNNIHSWTSLKKIRTISLFYNPEPKKCPTVSNQLALNFNSLRHLFCRYVSYTSLIHNRRITFKLRVTNK